MEKAKSRGDNLVKAAEFLAKSGDHEAAAALLALSSEASVKSAVGRLGLSKVKVKTPASSGFGLKRMVMVLALLVVVSSFSAFAAYGVALQSFRSDALEFIYATVPPVDPALSSIVQPTAASTDERRLQFEATQASLYLMQTDAAQAIDGTNAAINAANPLQQTQNAAETKLAPTATEMP